MDWPFNDPNFDKYDLDNVFEYSSRESTVLLRICGSKKVEQWKLDTDAKWKGWLSDDIFLLRKRPRPGLGIILAGREEEEKHNSSILEYLPFTRKTFGRITRTLPLHGDTARIINRSDQAMFTDMDLRGTRWDAIFYCCRTTSKYPGDVAVSSVFYPNSGLTAAILFGCSKDLTDDISGRLWTAENSTSHPLLVMGIVAEIERGRHDNLVKDQVNQLLRRVLALSNPETISTTSTVNRNHYSVDSWIKISQLRSELITWKGQLSRMVEHIDRLEEDVFADQASIQSADTDSDSLRFYDSEIEEDNNDINFGCDEEKMDLGLDAEHNDSQYCPLDEANWRQHGRKTGRRIKKRLGEIINDYDQNIRECTMVIDGLTLATQVSWNQIGYQDTQANLRIASDTRQDSSQMKAIATLTMIFLPATFVSSIFSMTFFNWSPGPGESVISPFTWLYPVIVTVITLVVLGVWHFCTRRRKLQSRNDSPV